VSVPPVRRRLRVLGLALGVAATLGACGGTGPTATAAPATPLPSGIVAVRAKEYAFIPASLTVPAGAVTLAVSNVGSENHEFEVLQGDQSLGKIDPFARETTKGLTVTLAAGEYTFICRLNGHDQLGMKGTLTVTGG
jgi:plastocyanin